MARKRRRRITRRRVGSVARKIGSSRARKRMINQRHVNDVVGGAGYALVEKLTLGPLSNVAPSVPIGIKQAGLAYLMSTMKGIVGTIGHAGLTVEAYSAASKFNVPLLGGAATATGGSNAF